MYYSIHSPVTLVKMGNNYLRACGNPEILTNLDLFKFINYYVSLLLLETGLILFI